MNERIERIGGMEARLNACLKETALFEESLEAFGALQEKIRALSSYYGSESWYADRDADERGELPENLKRGVLSEDPIYEVITRNRDLAIRMLEVATGILKGFDDT